jgi:hypothetical protein
VLRELLLWNASGGACGRNVRCEYAARDCWEIIKSAAVTRRYVTRREVEVTWKYLLSKID